MTHGAAACTCRVVSSALEHREDYPGAGPDMVTFYRAPVQATDTDQLAVTTQG